MIKLIDLDELDGEDAMHLGRFLIIMGDQFGIQDDWEISNSPFSDQPGLIAVGQKEDPSKVIFYGWLNKKYMDEPQLFENTYTICDICDNVYHRDTTCCDAD